jgi:DNA polymerase
MELENIKKEVLQCVKCNLHKTKTQYVFGEGSRTAPIVFVGEAPGRNEDIKGLPFVGRAGKVFDELLRSIELRRENVYICNVLKCRPPKNRSPAKIELDACTPYLKKQLDSINPKVVCPMGNFAANFVLKMYGLESKIDGISKLHGQRFKITNLFGTVEIIPLYHPAVATYNPDMKGILLEDFKMLKKND